MLVWFELRFGEFGENDFIASIRAPVASICSTEMFTNQLIKIASSLDRMYSNLSFIQPLSEYSWRRRDAINSFEALELSRFAFNPEHLSLVASQSWPNPDADIHIFEWITFNANRIRAAVNIKKVIIDWNELKVVIQKITTFIPPRLQGRNRNSFALFHVHCSDEHFKHEKNEKSAGAK